MSWMTSRCVRWSRGGSISAAVPILSGGQVEVLFENGAEVLLVLKAGALGDVEQGELGLAEEELGDLEALTDEFVVEGVGDEGIVDGGDVGGLAGEDLARGNEGAGGLPA